MSTFPKYGQFVSADDLRMILGGIKAPALLHGMDISVTANTLSVSPGRALTQSGVLLQRLSANTLVFTPTAAKKLYTIVWEHTHSNILGGNAETLSLVQGFYKNDELATIDANGFISPSSTKTIVGWIRYPGSSVDLSADHVIQAPRVRGFDRLLMPHRYPPFTLAVAAPAHVELADGYVDTISGLEYSARTCTVDNSDSATVIFRQSFAIDPTIPHRVLEFVFQNDYIEAQGPAQVIDMKVTCHADDYSELILAQPAYDESSPPMTGSNGKFTRVRLSLDKNPPTSIVTARITFTVPPTQTLSFLYMRFLPEFIILADYSVDETVNLTF